MKVFLKVRNHVKDDFSLIFYLGEDKSILNRGEKALKTKG